MTSLRYTTLAILLLCSCFATNLFAQPTFIISPEEAIYDTNVEVCFDVYADDFSDLIGFGFPITWDKNVLQFQYIKNINAPGLNRAAFDLSNTNNGSFSVNWEAANNFPQSLNNGFVLFNACFKTSMDCSVSTDIGIDTTGMNEGLEVYANRAFSLGGEIIGINIGFYERAARAVVACPCDFESRIRETTPPLSNEGSLDLCIGEEVLFRAAVDFLAGTEPIENLAYVWDFGDGTQAYTAETSHDYEEAGIYYISLNIVDTLTNCANNNVSRVKVRVAPAPSVDLVEGTTFCANTPIELSADNIFVQVGIANERAITPNSQGIISDAYHEETLLLPDGEGVAYESTITINSFDEDALIEFPNDLEGLCLNMEHSWARDLNISLICPNGEEVILHEFLGQSGNRIRLGEPIEGDDDNARPGVGYDYCWKSDATNGTWIAYAETNDPNSAFSLPAGDYQPVEGLDAFIGCPINGEWTLKVEDYWTLDNGFVFNWGIIFNENLLPETSSFSPGITSFSWQDNPDALSVSADIISFPPMAVGVLEVPYIITDEFGCTYEANLSVPIENTANCDGCENMQATISGELAICDGATTNLTASGGSSYQWSTGATSASISVSTVGNYTVTVSDAAGCSSTVRVSVSAGALPSLRFPSEPNCSRDGRTYSIRINTEVRNVLTASSGIVAGSSGFLTVYNIPLEEDVVVTVTNLEGCTITQAIFAPNCNGCPNIAAPQSLGNKTTCEGSAMPTLSVSSAGINSSSEVRWYTAAAGGTLIARGANLTPNQAGSYYAELFDTSNNCRSPRTEVRLTITDGPNAAISGNLEVCAGEKTILTASGGGTYAWNNFARSNKVSVRAGTYTVTVTASNGCQDVANVTVVEVNGPPCIDCPQKAPPQSNGNVEICSSEAIPPLSVTRAGVNSSSEIRWYTSAIGGSAIARGFEFTPSSAGTYYAEIFDTSNNCPSPRRAISLSIIPCLGNTAYASLPSKSDFTFLQAQPNPFQDVTTLIFQQITEAWVEVRLYDVAGRLVYQQAKYVAVGMHHWKIAAPDLGENGVYFYRIQSATQSVMGKLVLEE